MKIEDRGFRILDICDVIPSVESDGEVLRLLVRNGDAAYHISEYLTHEDLAKVIEALSEAHRRLAPASVPVTLAEAPVTRLRDWEGDVWTLRGNGLWSINRVDGADSREYIERHYGPVTELTDADALAPVTPAKAPVTRLRDREGFTWKLRENGLWSVNDATKGVRTREFVERECGPVTELTDDES